MTHSSAHILSVSLIAVGLAVTFPASAREPAKDGASLEDRCLQLNGMKIAAKRIGMPTKGAKVVSAEMIPACTESANPVIAHCKVSGRIHPVDPQSYDIRFEVRLPLQWNNRTLMLGGGGFDGTIPKLDEKPYNLHPTSPSPLNRGYAMFGGDAGHVEDLIEPGKFLLNDEAYRNWMGDALKKTHDAALAVIRVAYGSKPDKTYFLGGSSGGREGLIAAARWPQDWNGVIALYPARNQMVEILGGMGINQAFSRSGAYPSQQKRLALFNAAQQACDTLDGVKDGLISAVKQCNAIFDPRTATVDGTPLRCPEGADSGDTCLSDEQIAAINVMQHEQKFSVTLANGESSFPGYNLYTSDSGVPKAHPLQPMVTFLSLGVLAPAYPAKPGMPLMVTFGEEFARYGIFRDTSVNPLLFGPANIGPYGQRIIEMSRLDLPERDLSGFAARGGKLLVMHGTADMIVSPRNSEALYATLQQTMGKEKVAGFMRYYEVPGFGHAVSSDFAAGWDYLAALENWVEKGRDPGNNEVVMDLAGVPGRTRPLCQYPAWPKYSGTGDVNRAESFVCAAQ